MSAEIRALRRIQVRRSTVSKFSGKAIVVLFFRALRASAPGVGGIFLAERGSMAKAEGAKWTSSITRDSSSSNNNNNNNSNNNGISRTDTGAICR